MKLDYIYNAKSHLEAALYCISSSKIGCSCRDQSCDVCIWNTNIKSTLYDLEKIIKKNRNKHQGDFI